jgi:hypothetical protein
MFTGREFGEKSKGIYYAYLSKHRLEDTEANREIFGAAFYLGAKYAVQTSSDLSPHIARFMEFVMWLSGGDYAADDIQPPY